jgi:ABC-type bacteriocin/lantibiotic exporter with double-glycine peptidase domain
VPENRRLDRKLQKLIPDQKLGKLVSIHGIAPAYLQRAVIIAVLSFIFFLTMLAVFSVRQNFVYFFLSTAFLIIYLLTMFSWLMMRKNILKIYENGLSYRKLTARWDEIEAIETQKKGDKINCEIRKKKGEEIVLTESIYQVEQAIKMIEDKLAANKHELNTKI